MSFDLNLDIFFNRYRLLKNSKKLGKYVLYLCSRDQRVNDNIALNFAINLANTKKIPVIVVFIFNSKVRYRIYQHYEFMLKGLVQLSKDLNSRDIDFYFYFGEYKNFFENIKTDVDSLIFDFSPLRGHRNRINFVLNNLNCNVYEVDTHNIIPVWIASNKEEFGAYTIRPKIYRYFSQFFKQEILSWVDPIYKKRNILSNFDNYLFYQPSSENFINILNSLNIDKSEKLKFNFESGEINAENQLNKFIENDLEYYYDLKNNPSKNVLSNLSPYLHYGQIYSFRVVLEILNLIDDPTFLWQDKVNDRDSRLQKSIKTFLEELIVRKELADNFCFYNQNYDNLNGAKQWAQETLKKHSIDLREYIYSREEFENSKTHDELWNSAQNELVYKGKIHGYMRMYWAKKILEWTETPDQALNFAIYLNDKYSIDGHDPNGYVGILWSICGVHDRPWFERPIFGLIRYMSYTSTSKKFDIEEYINLNKYIF